MHSPIFHKNKFIVDFKQKADVFNYFFATQCTLAENTNKLTCVLESQILQTLLLSLMKYINHSKKDN